VLTLVEGASGLLSVLAPERGSGTDSGLGSSRAPAYKLPSPIDDLMFTRTDDGGWAAVMYRC